MGSLICTVLGQTTRGMGVLLLIVMWLCLVKLWWLLVVCFEISRRLDFCSVPEAELWGIMYGLQMAAEAKMEHLHVAADSLHPVMLVDDCIQSEDQFHEQISKIWKMKGSLTSCTFGHIGRDDNCLANKFAKFGFSLNLDCIFFQAVPSFASTVTKEVFMSDSMLNSS